MNLGIGLENRSERGAMRRGMSLHDSSSCRLLVNMRQGVKNLYGKRGYGARTRGDLRDSS